MLPFVLVFAGWHTWVLRGSGGLAMMTMLKKIHTPDYPVWVSDPVRHHLAHKFNGTFIRALARIRDVHPLMILR